MIIDIFEHEDNWQDIKDNDFGDYILLKLVDKKHNKQYGIFQCKKCGRKKEVSIYHMSHNKGISHKSCVHLINKNNKYYKRFHSIWGDMRKRTTNPNIKQWNDYGGRGISSEKYKFFIDFYDDLFDSYISHVNKFGEKDTTIDRIDVNGDYEPNNCKWSTRQEQNVNTRRKCKILATNLITNKINEFSCPSECANELSLNLNSIYNVLNGHSKTYKNYHFEYIKKERKS